MRTRLTGAGALLAIVLATAGAPFPPAHAASAQSPAPSPAPRQPNIVFVLADDFSWNLVQFMPHVLRMQQAGVTFVNYFVTNSLCCPSRASILTGRFPHNTGVLRNFGSDGGYLTFRNRGNENATFATALAAAGYRTSMSGKYLSEYLPARHGVPPGWTAWNVSGNGYDQFNYNLNQNGRVVRYGDKPGDYLTDVVSRLGVNFVRQSGAAPFLIEIATFAPHAPYRPAPRDADAFPGLVAPKGRSFNAPPLAGAPKWMSGLPALSSRDVTRIDAAFRLRAQSVLAIDKMVGDLQAAVAAAGKEKDTYFVFSSDNGYHMGEHRLMPGKQTAYDTDIRVPLIVTGPGVPAGRRVEEIVANIDLYPTFAELAGVAIAANVDGRSLKPFLEGRTPANWRNAALIEHRGSRPGDSGNSGDPDAPAARSGNPPPTAPSACATPYISSMRREKSSIAT